MFEEFSREFARLGLNKGISVPIQMPCDARGYLDRKCPHTECRANFKVLFEDWRDKVPDEAAYCPKCGMRENPTEFNTSAQTKYISDFATAYAAGELNEAFSRAARRTRPQRMSTGLFTIEMTVSFKTDPIPVVLPPGADEALRQDLACELCGCRHSTIGVGYFCPACGNNSAQADVDHAIETTLKTVNAMDEIKEAMAAKYDADVAAM